MILSNRLILNACTMYMYDVCFRYKHGTTLAAETNNSGTQTAHVLYNTNPLENLTLPEGKSSAIHVFFLAVDNNYSKAEKDLIRG